MGKVLGSNATAPTPSSPTSTSSLGSQQQQRRQQCRDSDKLLVLLTITAFILSVAHIFLHSHELPSHHHDRGTGVTNTHPHHKNVLKEALDNFVQKGNIKNKNRESGVADEKIDKEENEEPGVAASDRKDTTNGTNEKDKTASAVNVDTGSDLSKPQTVDKEGKTEVKNGENHKTSVKQKVLSFFGKNDNGINSDSIKQDLHPVAHLNCADHDGPTDPQIIDEMVFWVRHPCLLHCSFWSNVLIITISFTPPSRTYPLMQTIYHQCIH